MKTIAIFVAFIIGYFSPWAASFNWLIRYLIVVMMFVTMLQMRFSMQSFKWSHLYILAANLVIGLGSWGILLAAGYPVLAQAAFFTGISPTATAAPVIVGILGGKINYSVNAFMVTNTGVALLMPFMIPMVIGQTAGGVFIRVIGDLIIVIVLPLLAALAVRRLWKNYAVMLPALRTGVFYIWVLAIFLIIANASEFIRKSGSGVSKTVLLEIAAVSLIICIVNFAGGRFLENRYRCRESSQTLGQKNTTLTIFLAITYASPLVALGPTFYVIWHNTWNALQIRARERRDATRKIRKV